jgi:hypothetical protein
MPFTKEEEENIIKELQDLRVKAREVNDFNEFITIKQRIKDYEKKLDVFRKITGNLI